MSDYKEFLERHKFGMPILEQLFKLNKDELKKKLQTICGHITLPEGLLKEGSVEKTISNDVPKSIEVWYYDHISISPYGINYKPEHGNEKEIIAFNEHFKL